MNPEVVEQLKTHLGANGLPYPIPIHPNLVHLTIALFILGITFDFIGTLFPLQKPIFKFLAIPANRSSFFEAGWYNMLGSALITIFTVTTGFYEIMLAEPLPGVKSAWGLQAMETMLWHGVGGVFLLAAMKSASAAPVKEDAGNVEGLPVEDIEVDAKQWAWVFRYPGTDITTTELHLPINHRIRLTLRSEDVLHGFYIPAFRVKQDIIPNRNIDFEFTPTRIGKYQLTDSQFSGTYFATMQADVIVESPEDYKRWLAETANRRPCIANNQAASEYAQESKELIKGWTTVVPAKAPVVNSNKVISHLSYSLPLCASTLLREEQTFKYPSSRK